MVVAASISLRSAVARNAVLCLGEMYQHLSHLVPVAEDVGSVVVALIGRAVSEKRFIRQAARDALDSAVSRTWRAMRSACPTVAVCGLLAVIPSFAPRFWSVTHHS